MVHDGCQLIDLCNGLLLRQAKAVRLKAVAKCSRTVPKAETTQTVARFARTAAAAAAGDAQLNDHKRSNLSEVDEWSSVITVDTIRGSAAAVEVELLREYCRLHAIRCRRLEFSVCKRSA
jgi:hypothetical protein